MFNSKCTNLTPLQVFTLIGLSKPDIHGQVIYRDFAIQCKHLIGELFSMKVMSEKAELIESKQYEQPANLEEI